MYKMPDAAVVQELVGYLKQEGHLEGQAGTGIMQAPNLDQLINLLQRSQVCTCMSPTWGLPLSPATLCSVCCTVLTPTYVQQLHRRPVCLHVPLAQSEACDTASSCMSGLA